MPQEPWNFEVFIAEWNRQADEKAFYHWETSIASQDELRASYQRSPETFSTIAGFVSSKLCMQMEAHPL